MKKIILFMLLALFHTAVPASADDRFTYEFELGMLGSVSGYTASDFYSDFNSQGDTWLNGDWWLKGTFGYQINPTMSLHAIPEIVVSAGANYDPTSFGFLLKAAYFQFSPSWGNVYVGRIDNNINLFGMAGLGYDPLHDPDLTVLRPFSTDFEADGLRLEYNRGAFRLTAQARLITAYNRNDVLLGSGVYHRAYRGLYVDYGFLNREYHLEGAYFWASGAASLGLSLYRGHDWSNFDDSWSSASILDVVPALVQTWGAFSLHAEAHFAVLAAVRQDGSGARVKEDPQYGLGLYLDGVYDYGPGSLTLAGWITSGNKIGGEQKWRGSGMYAFNPLLVAYWNPYNNNPMYIAQFSMRDQYLNSFSSSLPLDIFNSLDAIGAFSTISQASYTANHFGLALFGEHTFSEKIRTRASLAWLSLVNPDWRFPVSGVYTDGDWSDLEYATQKRNVGFEIDLGLTLTLAKGLELDLTGGYLFSGPALDNISYTFTPSGSYPDPDGALSGQRQSAPNFANFYAKLTYTF